MHFRTAVIPLLLAASASAQLSLAIPPGVGALQYIWVPGPTTNTVGFFMDLTVHSTVTIQAVSFPTYTPIGRQLTFDMYVTNTGITTYVGQELSPANWTLVGSSTTEVPLGPATAYACFPSGVTLQPGTYGLLFGVTNANNIFSDLGPQTYSNTELTVVAGATTAQLWINAPAAYGTSTFHFNGTIHYAAGAVPHSCAQGETYGAGCQAVSGSFYQTFSSNAAMSAALNGRRLTLIYSPIGYVLTQSAPGVTYIPPTAAATSLPTSNNGETLITVPGTILYPGGSTTQLVINTDGHVSPITNLAFPGQNYSFMPFVHGLLNAANPIWAICWHNFNTTESGSGLIKHELVGNLFVVTWDNVESLPGSAAAPNPNPCTFQIQFDMSTGDVHYVYQSMTTIGGSQSYDDTIVGWSPGGPSPDLGPIDVTTVSSLFLPVNEVMPLTLAASAPPVLGTTVDLTTSNETGLNLGINFLSLGAVPAPGLDLFFLGAPGCFAHIDILTMVGNLITNLGAPLPPMTVSLPIPATMALSGVLVTSQSLWLDALANPFGAITSNAVSLTLGAFAL